MCTLQGDRRGSAFEVHYTLYSTECCEAPVSPRLGLTKMPDPTSRVVTDHLRFRHTRYELSTTRQSSATKPQAHVSQRMNLCIVGSDTESQLSYDGGIGDEEESESNPPPNASCCRRCDCPRFERLEPAWLILRERWVSKGPSTVAPACSLVHMPRSQSCRHSVRSNRDREERRNNSPIQTRVAQSTLWALALCCPD